MAGHTDIARDPPRLPIEFGTSWNEFARDWCLGGVLGTSQVEAIRALDALRRLWPEEVAKHVSAPYRGLAHVVGAIEKGTLLADCERMDGFEPVLTRLRGGERSAYSELVLGSSLASLGYRPEFGAALNGKVLDVRCDVEARPVYFEVLTPDRAEQSIDAQQLTEQLGNAIRSSVSACRVEVAVLATLDAQAIQEIVRAVRDAMPGQWITVNSVARIRRVNEGQRLPSTFDGEGASIVIAGDSEVQGASTGLVIRWEDNDERAKRLFNAEYHHFSECVSNVLVVNVCAIADGINAWTNWMRRVLQPKQNRKVAAVILFDQGVLGSPAAIQRRWKVIVNAYSHLSVPESLAKGFESLDESAAWFGQVRPVGAVGYEPGT
jgi:hypothetical protein